MSDVREVEAVLQGYLLSRLEGSEYRERTDAWRDEELGRKEYEAMGFVWDEGPVYRSGVLGRWRDRFVRSMEDRLSGEADRELGLVPEEGSVLADAKRGIMVTAGWVDEVHRVELSTPGQSSPVLDMLRHEYRIDPPVSSFEEALARVTAAFVASEEEVLAQAAAAALRARGWAVYQEGHLHTWSQHLRPRDFIMNRWSCECGAVKTDEGMPEEVRGE